MVADLVAYGWNHTRHWIFKILNHRFILPPLLAFMLTGTIAIEKRLVIWIFVDISIHSYVIST